MIDPHRGIDATTDVVLAGGKIESVGRCAEPRIPILDARGLLVVPGIIDLHAHVFHGLSSYGIDPEHAGVLAGCTRVNDMGSVGWMTFAGFLELIVRPAATRITCFPNMLSMGMPDNWALGATAFVNERYYPELLAEHARRHPDLLRGVKVFVERGFLSNLDDTWKAFEGARQVTDATGVNLYAHLGDLFPKHAERPSVDPRELVLDAVTRMRPGEILGHCFTQFPGGLVDADGRVSPAARIATDNGVLHEVGHGLNFSFARARRLLDAGVPVDIISSDVHGRMHAGRPRTDHGLDSDMHGAQLDWSMMSTMSKCLALGMSLADVIRASTITPAKALGLDAIAGSLTPGFDAEVSILELVPGRFRLDDSEGERLVADHVFVPVRTILRDRVWTCAPFDLPAFRNDYLARNPEAFSARTGARSGAIQWSSWNIEHPRS